MADRARTLAEKVWEQHVVVRGEGEESENILEKIEEKYNKDETDEFLKPIIVNGDEGRIKERDTLFFFNYRSDRMREIATVIGLPDKPIEIDIPKDLVSSYLTRIDLN